MLKICLSLSLGHRISFSVPQPRSHLRLIVATGELNGLTNCALLAAHIPASALIHACKLVISNVSTKLTVCVRELLGTGPPRELARDG